MRMQEPSYHKKYARDIVIVRVLHQHMDSVKHL